MQTFDLDTVCAIVVKAREFQAKAAVVEPGPGSNPTDDRMIEVLEDHGDDPVQHELHRLIDDQKSELVRSMWLGRDDFDKSEWRSMRQETARLDPRRTSGYLIETPLLADYFEEGMAAFGLSWEDFERNRLQRTDAPRQSRSTRTGRPRRSSRSKTSSGSWSITSAARITGAPVAPNARSTSAAKPDGEAAV